MKTLLLFLLLPLTSHAFVLTQYLSSPDGSSAQSFDISSKKVECNKASNFFDTTKDYSLGKYELVNDKASEEDLKKLKETLTKIKEVDAFLKKRGSEYEDLSSKKPHESFLILDGFRITKGSDLYPEMKAIYDKYAGKNWKHISGIKLSSDGKNLIYVKNGKNVAQETFNFSFHCKREEPPSVCAFKDLGILFVGKDK